MDKSLKVPAYLRTSIDGAIKSSLVVSLLTASIFRIPKVSGRRVQILIIIPCDPLQRQRHRLYLVSFRI